MNKTILHGKWRQLRGALKIRWAEFRDDDKRMLDGKVDQMVGMLQERYGYTQQEAPKVLAHYLGRYGKRKAQQRTMPARRWLLAIPAAALFIVAGWFMMERVLVERPHAPGEEFPVNPEVEFA
jgi:uncharacterized protein YjbJ (UPF0337 family)